MATLFSHLWQAIVESFLDPSERVYWGSILGALVLILIRSGRRWRQNMSILGSLRLWWHPSSRADVKLLVANNLLRMLLFPGSMGLALILARSVSQPLRGLWGESVAWNLPAEFMIFSFTLVLFLVDDFARFYLHWLQHRWAWLWCFHQVHHSAQVLTPLTLYRSHPLELVMIGFRDVLTYGTVTGIFGYLFGPKLSTWTILGVNAFAFLFNVAGANLRHSQVWIHFGRLESWFLSPAAHQLHHSRDPAHFDKNFGVCLALWDRVFGTFYDVRTVNKALTFGLELSPLDSKEQSLVLLYLEPLRQSWSLMRSSLMRLVSFLRQLRGLQTKGTFHEHIL